MEIGNIDNRMNGYNTTTRTGLHKTIQTNK